MKVLIFEDEPLTGERLVKLLEKYSAEIEVLNIIESVKQGVNWFKSNPKPDLVFMDIQLTDGTSFEIFKEINIDAPIIFTTAYDQYAIQAFKVNSVDYLLKPIDYADLEAAIHKFEKLSPKPETDNSIYKVLLNHMLKPHKQRFLVKIGEQLKHINTADIAYFINDEGVVFAFMQNGKRYMLDYTIEQLDKEVDPLAFFRINRKFIVSLPAINQIHRYFNSRLKLKLKPEIDTDIIVSRERVNDFKAWLDK
ncbi:MAG: LytTR family DNA-binding domain-containing protein [Salinivirgaceae bacterium]|jgi:DNA-binding LytR/AlgR family response regulator|nr:LytTR family DNA-binding domain-containing protein [Salinivirgaceae bacterium]